MKVTKRQLQRIIKEERARMLSEQGTGSETDKEVAVDAAALGDESYDAIMDLIVNLMMASVPEFPGDDVHPAVYNALIKALKEVAVDLEVEKKEIHPPEFITLWEPGYGPGSVK